jgi:hypothetical protein
MARSSAVNIVISGRAKKTAPKVAKNSRLFEGFTCSFTVQSILHLFAFGMWNAQIWRVNKYLVACAIGPLSR